MADTTQLLVAAQIRALREDGNRDELVSGEFVSRESSTPAHDRLLARLHEALSAHADDADLGAVFQFPWPLELSKLDLVKPDLFFVSWENPAQIRATDVCGTPELVVEVLSPESSARDRGEKKRLYSWSGVREYWIVDPGARTFTGFTRTAGGYVPIAASSDRFQSTLLPDLELDLEWLFAAIDEAPSS